MYPPGIRVIRVKASKNNPVGQTGTVRTGTTSGGYSLEILRAVSGLSVDILIEMDQPTVTVGDTMCPAGCIIASNASIWRPINPDADEWQSEEQKELEQT